jgi:hypothetical protein
MWRTKTLKKKSIKLMSVVRIMAYGYMRLDTVISVPKPWDSLLQQTPKETETTTQEPRYKPKIKSFHKRKFLNKCTLFRFPWYLKLWKKHGSSVNPPSGSRAVTYRQTDGQTFWYNFSSREPLLLLLFNIAGSNMYLGLHVRCQILLSNFNQIWILTTDFPISSQYQGTHKSVQWQPRR